MASIVNYLEDWASAHPNKLLFSFLGAQGTETEAYTYGEFLCRSRHLAAYLSCQEGIKHGDRVLLSYLPGLDIILAFFACARIGAIPVPVAPPTTGAVMTKLTRIAVECSASVVLTDDELLRSMNPEGSAASALSTRRWISTEAFKDKSIGIDYHVPCCPHPILFLQYTSGSTDDARGVMVSHDNVIANARATIDHKPTGVSWLPQYHDMGLIGYYLFPVVCGGTTYGFSPQTFLKRPALWLRTISRVQATYASSPNFGFAYCLRPGKIHDAELDQVDLSSLRVLMNASEPVRHDTREHFLRRFVPFGLRREACVVAYGLAEHTLAATHYGRRTLLLDQSHLQRGCARIVDAETEKHSAVSVVSCGSPLSGVQLRIVDPQTRRLLSDGNVGEVWLAGPAVSAGYWQRETMTREVFHNRLADDGSEQLGFLRSGDLGFLHDNELFICGRSKDLLISKGVNYYPQDIELAVESTCPAAIRSGGVAAFHGNHETIVVVIEVRRSIALPDAARIACAIQARCLLTPDTIIFSPPHTIARTTSGKSARQLTRARYLRGELPCLLTYHPPRLTTPPAGSGSAKELRARCANVFTLCGSADPATTTLAELGLDSLMFTDLLLELESALPQQLDKNDLADCIDITLLQRLTVAQFSTLLDQLEDGSIATLCAGHGELAKTRAVYETNISRRMRADAQLEAFDDPAIVDKRTSDVLLTGATGFFGPFLLHSLLMQTSCRYQVLVRAENNECALKRIHAALQRSGLLSPALEAQLSKRVLPVCGDIAAPDLGLPQPLWERLSKEICAIVHNAAAVNYVATYETLKPHNVDGTRTLLRLARAFRSKRFHHISSTFIFGWTARGLLLESDNNDEMSNLDFGYAQTKWVAEQLVLAAQARGLDARIYRPSLVSTSTKGAGDRSDVAVRLLAFMINQGIAVDTKNQLSILPADIVADNIANIISQESKGLRTFHITADRYYNMVDLIRSLEHEHRYQFTHYDIPGFINQMNRRCTKADPLYPLLDFFNRSASKIAAMQLKRYSNRAYQEAREQSDMRRNDPTLAETVSYLLAYLRAQNLIDEP